MKYKNILVTGGAGFVGSNLCLKFKNKYKKSNIIALDNLVRSGSELNIPRLRDQGIEFVHGDIRNKEDLNLTDIDLLIECSAEPSVMAGISSSPEYLINTNLAGAINCFELARKNKADVIFISTSRVYPVEKINSLKFKEQKTRFSLSNNQSTKGASERGVSEDFPLDGVRSLYGATKLSAELILQEYINNYGIRGVINRSGLISGPWQMGKTDQGVIAYWMAKHIFKQPLSYIGFGGEGKQVRDVLDIDDLFNLLVLQIENIDQFNGKVYNIGGGLKNSLSLKELTDLCQKISGNKTRIKSVNENRKGDIRMYITDYSRINKVIGWEPKKEVQKTLEETYDWIINNRSTLENILK